MNLIPWKSKSGHGDINQLPADSNITRFRHEFDRMFDRFFEEPFGLIAEPFASFGKWAPSLDVVESDEEFTIKAELPGLDPKELDISISGNVLTLSGEKRESTEQKSDSYYHSECRFGTFRRAVQLPSYVDTEKVSAQHNNGVLTIRLAKQSSVSPKRIPVKVSTS